jgi:PAS domain S-box-containing protein
MSLEIERPDWLLQMEGILETLNEGVLISDDCHHMIFANKCLLDMVGLPAEQILGKTPAEFYPPEDGSVLAEHIAQGEQAGHHRFEFYLPRGNGERVPVIISSRVLEDPEGSVFAVVTFTDISEQKRAEQELKEVNEQLEERHKDIEEDLVLAARVQQSLAPKGLLWGGLEVAAHYHPVRRIGGDFGLVAPSGDDYLNLMVCDVSGHGIGSALVANRIYTETLSQLERNIPLGQMLRHLNRFVMQNLGGSVLYFTIAAARVSRDARLEFAGGGHPPAILIRPGEPPRLLESRSMVLGLLENAVDAEAVVEVQLERGDRLALYTDGLTEVFDARGEMLGVDGLQEIIREASPKPLAEMKQTILDRVAAFRSGPATDDVSLVLLDVP